MSEIKKLIESGKAVMGLEFGSTRIKAVLIDEAHNPIASGSHDWENRLENGIWTYTLDDIWTGLRDCYQDLVKDVKTKYDAELTELRAIGFSAMMHGYMAFNKEGELMVPFRTWRNGNTGEASAKLIELFQYNIPLRWSIAHLYQSMLEKDPHVKDLDYVATLAGYIHWMLTGKRVLGVGDASGMFPIDPATGDYDQVMVDKFQALVDADGYTWKLRDIFPKVLSAGEDAGVLTEEGAKLLDPTGKLQPGCPLCPPEGDAGTGMVATNSVGQRTGNVSAGTSIFGMIVLEESLKGMYEEIDMVTTPDGSAVAMVHANNCTSDLNAWVGLFKECLESFGVKVAPDELYGTLYRKSLEGDPDCGGLLSYGFLSGEFIARVDEGRPMFVRSPKSNFNLANFMRSNLFTALGALKVGMEILQEKEAVKIDTIFGHGGLFKTPGVGQNYLAAVMNAPVSVMTTAGEGGAWGIAVLAAYEVCREEGEKLEDYLKAKVFADSEILTVQPDEKDIAGMNAFIERFKKGLPIEQCAGNYLD